jgi:DNA repair protein RecN (Recombination protein N)
MLQELRVENLLLIERAELRLAPGLNVLTGETGAGKTVLAHALDLLLGGRARSGIVRPGAREAYVEGVFDPAPDVRARLEERLGERLDGLDGEVVLARRVSGDGRTRAYINGRTAPVAQLREAGALLLAFYGQHEHRRLTLAAAQLEILDAACAGGHDERLAACEQAHARRRAAERRVAELRELDAQRERELDLLDYELGEVDAVEPDEAEYDRLRLGRERLRKVDSLRAAAGAGALALADDAGEGGGAAQRAAGALAGLQSLAGVDPALDSLAERMGALVIESRELSAELRDYGESVGAESQDGPELTLQALEERLAAIERLARKHGGSVASVLEFAASARERRAELAASEEALADAEQELDRSAGDLAAAAAALREARVRAAPKLARAVRAQLAELAMPEASFEIELTEGEVGPRGADEVELLIAPNPGVPSGPLREIASGGELSRVMLSIMAAGQGGAGDSTLVFDEVDAGIGGHTARAVGERLRALASQRQVLCITHLPQVASLAERHFAIVKDTSVKPTRTTVVQLADREVESELVRMLGADGDDAGARRHAKELLRAA